MNNIWQSKASMPQTPAISSYILFISYAIIYNIFLVYQTMEKVYTVYPQS